MKAITIINGVGFVLLYALVSLIGLAFAAVGWAVGCVALVFTVAAKGVLRVRDALA
jgi:hypothetical protein